MTEVETKVKWARIAAVGKQGMENLGYNLKTAEVEQEEKRALLAETTKTVAAGKAEKVAAVGLVLLETVEPDIYGNKFPHP